MAQVMIASWIVGPLSYGDLCVAESDGRSAVHWCQRHKLLPTSKNCPRCARSMNLVERIGRGSGPEGFTWRCPRKSCQKEVSLRSGTFFEGTVSFFYACKLILVHATENRQSPNSTILRIIHLWSSNKKLTMPSIHADII